MYRQIENRAKELEPEILSRRRDLHLHPELGWCEFRTASLVASHLRELGYQVLTGAEACRPESRMGIPEDEVLSAAYQKALAEGGVAGEMLPMSGGLTGVVGIMDCGPGPTVALRFDMDALPIRGCMHACGHDGHTAIGLAVARILTEIRPQLTGTVRLLFQPAEEGVRGARSMVDAGHLDNVDYFLSGHVLDRKGISEGDADLIPSAYGSLATTKLDVTFLGKAAHAGICPDKGINVLPPLAEAIPKLLRLPEQTFPLDPKGNPGIGRLNIGRLSAGIGRNIIPDRAFLEMEVRGSTTDICSRLEQEARKILEEAARSGHCRLEIKTTGSAPSLQSTPELAARIQRVCGYFAQVRSTSCLGAPFSGSEDVAWMMERVRKQGGQACFLYLLNDFAGPPHSPSFDLEENCLWKGAAIYAAMVYDLLKKIRETHY